MRLIFVHGWSVTNTDTYGEMPQALSAAASTYGLELNIQHVYLGRYISFHDEVTVDDISRAMDRALRELPGNSNKRITNFSCVTHSTGGPIVRHWADKFYGDKGLNKLPLKHLVMLSPANHGSTLGTLGKKRVSRIKSWFQGVEPGQRVLDWLCLGSDGQWSLNERYLNYNYADNKFFPFVLVGQGIDSKFYDFLNSYLVEKGSDGVVRVAGANMNYRYFSLVQSREKIVRKSPKTYSLEADSDVKVSPSVPLGVYNNYSHSGKKMGIMRRIKKGDKDDQVIKDILKCLRVKTVRNYQDRAAELSALTKEQQAKGKNRKDKEDGARYCMLVFNVKDDQGEHIGQDNYDLFLLAGNQYQPQKLPKHFFKDRQMNTKNGRLVYYLNADKMKEIKDGKFGIRVVARPSKGFSYYCVAEYHSDGVSAMNILIPNETTYVDITLHRFVDKNVFRFDAAKNGSKSFKHIKPSGDSINNS